MLHKVRSPPPTGARNGRTASVKKPVTPTNQPGPTLLIERFLINIKPLYKLWKDKVNIQKRAE